MERTVQLLVVGGMGVEEPDPRDPVQGGGTTRPDADERLHHEPAGESARPKPSVAVPPSGVPAGWYPDVGQPGWLRWWDGYGWQQPRTPAPPVPLPRTTPTPSWAPPAAGTGRTLSTSYLESALSLGGEAPPRHEGRSGVAIASLVLSILWIFGLGSLVGIVLGVIALYRRPQTQQRGRGFAISGILLGILGVLVIVAPYLKYPWAVAGLLLLVLLISTMGFMIQRPMVVSIVRRIERPVGDVVAALSAPSTWASLSPGTTLTDVEVRPTGGFVARANVRRYGMSACFMVATDRYEPPHLIRFGSRDLVRGRVAQLCMVRVSDYVEWTLTEEGESATRVSVSARWPKVPALGRLMFGVRGRRQLSRVVHRITETGPTPTG